MAVEMLATLCITKLQGDARPSLYPRTACCRWRPGMRVWRAASINEHIALAIGRRNGSEEAGRL